MDEGDSHDFDQIPENRRAQTLSGLRAERIVYKYAKNPAQSVGRSDNLS